MPEKNSALAALEWEAHDEADYRKALNRDLAADGAPALGEQFAGAVNCKTKADLLNMMEEKGEEIGEDLVEFLVAAEDSLKMRLDLVRCAFARLFAVSKIIDSRKSKRKPPRRHRVPYDPTA